MMFTPWINNLAGNYRPRPWPDAAPRPASLQEQKFMSRVLSGAVWWSVTEETLAFRRPDVGSLDFAAHLAGQMQQDRWADRP